MNRETNNTTNVLVVGTGGQGVITASEILSDVAMLSGFDTKKSEIHGMSQRGGGGDQPCALQPEGLLAHDHGRRGGYPALL